MKKILIFIFACILLSGCNKKDKNIVINIYNDNKEEVVYQDIVDDGIEEVKPNDDSLFDLKKSQNNGVLTESETINSNIELEKIVESDNFTQDESKIEKVKNWYNDNKDGLKNISSDIIEEDINSVKNMFGSAKNWYNDNKDELKNSVDEIYNNDKDTLNNLYKKIKKDE